MEPGEFDYLICLSLENTEEVLQPQRRPLYLVKETELMLNPDKCCPTLEFDWCAYSVSSQLATEEQNSFIKPPKLETLTPAVQARTGIKPSDIEGAPGLGEAIHKVCHLLHRLLVEPIHLQVVGSEESLLHVCDLRGLGAVAAIGGGLP